MPDTHTGDFPDEEDPITTNLYSFDIEFENGLENPLTWIFGDCHSPNIPLIDTVPFNPPYKPGPHISNLKALSCAEVMEKYHPNSLYSRFAVSSGQKAKSQHRRILESNLCWTTNLRQLWAILFQKQVQFAPKVLLHQCCTTRGL